MSGYGLIPEVVYASTSVTARTTRTFDNFFGRFVYRHIKKELFWGYLPVSTQAGQYLAAEPEKAVLDYLYLNLAGIRGQEDFDGIRLNRERLRARLDPDRDQSGQGPKNPRSGRYRGEKMDGKKDRFGVGMARAEALRRGEGER